MHTLEEVRSYMHDEDLPSLFIIYQELQQDQTVLREYITKYINQRLPEAFLNNNANFLNSYEKLRVDRLERAKKLFYEDKQGTFLREFLNDTMRSDYMYFRGSPGVYEFTTLCVHAHGDSGYFSVNTVYINDEERELYLRGTRTLKEGERTRRWDFGLSFYMNPSGSFDFQDDLSRNNRVDYKIVAKKLGLHGHA